MPKVLIKRGTRAQLDTAKNANGLSTGELYLITDEGKLAVGTAVNAYVEVQAQDGDLNAIAALSGTSGLLKKTAANTWELDTAAYTTNTGTVTSVGLSVPTGLSVSSSPVTGSGTIAVSFAAGYSIPTTASQSNWDTAYTDRLKWDGGSTGLVAATARTSLGLVIGTNVQAYDADLDTWATKSAPSGTVVGTTDTQTLSAKTLTGTKETVFAITDGASVTITATNGGIQTWTLGAARTASLSFATGESVLLIASGNFALTLTGAVWVSATDAAGSAPTASASRARMIELFCVGSTVYAAFAGYA